MKFYNKYSSYHLKSVEKKFLPHFRQNPENSFISLLSKNLKTTNELGTNLLIVEKLINTEN